MPYHENTHNDGTVESRVNNAVDFALIDTIAKVWIDAGGDAEGMAFCWTHIRDRISELT
jgi:hypothetical protein